MGGVGSEIEESECSSVDIGNTLDTDGFLACRIRSPGVTQRPLVVTIFGRAVKVGYLEKQDALRGWSVTRPRSVTRINTLRLV